MRNARYRLGEGIVGRVAQSGRTVVVPQVSREPLFLDRSGVFRRSGRDEMSYVCVPIRAEHRTVGALGVALPYQEDRDYDQDAKFFGVVASMIGQAVRVHRLVEAERQRLVEENTQLRRELRERYDFRNIIGSSRAMQAVYEQIAQVAHASTTVLIRGETGTGKELVAHAIHYNSPRAKQAVHQGQLRGAARDPDRERAVRPRERAPSPARAAQKKGRFELADGGTIFLDEIGDLSPATQVKLLRVLQEREFERVGGTQTDQGQRARHRGHQPRPREQLMAEGTFRQDLYYRLNVFPIHLPPLRERKTDILLLADHFVEKYARGQRQGRPAHLDAGHRHADELPLAGQRARAGELHRARRAAVRRTT